MNPLTTYRQKLQASLAPDQAPERSYRPAREAEALGQS
jgi:hypothetical protein